MIEILTAGMPFIGDAAAGLSCWLTYLSQRHLGFRPKSGDLEAPLSSDGPTADSDIGENVFPHRKPRSFVVTTVFHVMLR